MHTTLVEVVSHKGNDIRYEMNAINVMNDIKNHLHRRVGIFFHYQWIHVRFNKGRTFSL